MALKKSLMIAGAVASIGMAGGAAGISAVSAESGDSGHPLVDKIAQRFNLDKNEVAKVFEEGHAEMKAKHTADMEERLSQAVTDGKLTEDQKSKILAKLEELKASRPSPEDMKDKTPEEHKALMEQKHAELKTWAQENNIPEEYMPMGMRVKFHRGPGGPKEAGGDTVHFEHSADSAEES